MCTRWVAYLLDVYLCTCTTAADPYGGKRRCRRDFKFARAALFAQWSEQSRFEYWYGLFQLHQNEPDLQRMQTCTRYVCIPPSLLNAQTNTLQFYTVNTVNTRIKHQETQKPRKQSTQKKPYHLFLRRNPIPDIHTAQRAPRTAMTAARRPPSARP